MKKQISPTTAVVVILVVVVVAGALGYFLLSKGGTVGPDDDDENMGIEPEEGAEFEGEDGGSDTMDSAAGEPAEMGAEG